MEARRPLGVRRPPPADADRDQPARGGQARRQGRGGYFGPTFGRPFDVPLPWFDQDAEPNADMWATAQESREQLVGLYHRAWEHADATIDELALDAVGHVPWWPPERRTGEPRQS